MKAKVESIHYLGLMILASLMLFAAEGRADTATTDASTSASASPSPGEIKGPAMSDSRRKARHTFYLGVCVGQTLAKQGTYFSDVLANVTDSNRDDLKSAIRSALNSCKEGMKPQATPTPSATPLPTTAPIIAPTSTATTTSASES